MLEDPDGYVITDAGKLGSSYRVSAPQFSEEFSDWDAAIEAIRSRQDRERFWPATVYVNDHGNVDLVDVVSGDLMALEDHVDLDGAGLGELG